MFTVAFSSKAEKDFLGFSSDIKEHIANALQRFREDPYPAGSKKLKGALAGTWRLRVGNYRIIYDVYPKDRTIFILNIGPRKSIYR